MRAELARKAIHVASASIPVAYALALVTRPQLLVGLGALGAVAAAVEVARLRSARARALFVGAFGRLLRARELGGWSGATWLVLAYLLAALLFDRAVAVAAMLAAALGDAAAAVVGKSVATARRRAGAAVRAGKTLVGSAACLAATFAGAWLVARLPLGASLAAAAAAALAERWEPPRFLTHVDDNVRVALASGVAALVMQTFLSRGTGP